jgi:hypothetical protein
MTQNDAPNWKIYERVVAAFEVEAAGIDASVTPNASLIGSISGVKRQIDVLVDARWDVGIERRIIYDAKRRMRKIDVKDVETFEGLMRDVRAARGVLVCSNGHTKAALRRAEQLIDIRLLTEDEALETDHAAVDPCPHCAIKKRKPRGLVFWDGQFPLRSGPMIAMVFTGKCDVCRSFAFWCWDCGEKVVVPDGERYVCACERRWFTEANNDDVLFVVATDDGEVPLDRRPVR